MICNSCFDVNLPACQDVYTIIYGLEPETEYHWLLEDKFSKVYGMTITTDVDGEFTIDFTEETEGLIPPFTKDLLNQFAGVFLFKIYLAADNTLITFTHNEVEYDCVSIAFRESIGDAYLPILDITETPPIE